MSAADPAATAQVAHVIAGNIRSIAEARQQLTVTRSRSDRIADAINRFAGSLLSVYVHAALFGGWILLNLGLVPGLRPWDPFPFVMLAMWASCEAIFLSTFVLISQNRMSALADHRAELDLHVNLLSEHEITRLLVLVDEIAKAVGARRPEESQVELLKEEVAPRAVLDEALEEEQRRAQPLRR